MTVAWLWVRWVAGLAIGSTAGKCVAAVLAGFIALKVYGYNKKQEGKQEVRVEAKKAGKKAHAKSEQAHTAAEKPGAPQRLLRSSCRDCD